MTTPLSELLNIFGIKDTKPFEDFEKIEKQEQKPQFFVPCKFCGKNPAKDNSFCSFECYKKFFTK